MNNIETNSDKFGKVSWQPRLAKFDSAHLSTVVSFYGGSPDLYKIDKALKEVRSNTLNDIYFIALSDGSEVIKDRNEYRGYSDNNPFTIRGKDFKELTASVHRVKGDYEHPPCCRFKHNIYDYFTDAANDFMRKEFEAQLLEAVTPELLNALIDQECKYVMKKTTENIDEIRKQLDLIENYQPTNNQ